ncbi:LytR C-terminal domain-containing protein [Modestobacter sp. I12A-02662]|uniref:LytR C-terminal domain-containing protein n=1 Tax=Modestobacter sp. I12A-02662 TaxID=1730496 RepID=UPI0034DEC74C
MSRHSPEARRTGVPPEGGRRRTDRPATPPLRRTDVLDSTGPMGPSVGPGTSVDRPAGRPIVPPAPPQRSVAPQVHVEQQVPARPNTPAPTAASPRVVAPALTAASPRVVAPAPAPTAASPRVVAPLRPAAPPPTDATQRVSAAPADSGRTGSAVRPPASGPQPVRGPRTPARPEPPEARAAAAPERPAGPPVGRGPEAVGGPASGPVGGPVGGRAAVRAERQAAEAARRKSGKRTPSGAQGSTAAGRGPEPAGDQRPGAPRRAVQGLLGVVVVALVVLGVWSFSAPVTEETSVRTPAQSQATSSAPATSAAPEAAAPEAAVPPVEEVPAPVGPVRAPITVLNSTTINGLAGDVGDQFSAAGWEVRGTAAYTGSDVAVTTVYVTEGDVQQQQAAAQLIEQFPDLIGPATRFFDVPGVVDPGLVVVATGNWRP